MLDNSKEEELKDTFVRLRLAGISLDEKKYDDGLRLLEAGHGESFDGLYADLKGDLLANAGKVAEARAAYQIAIDKMGRQGSYHNIVQMKLDASSSLQLI